MKIVKRVTILVAALFVAGCGAGGGDEQAGAGHGGGGGGKRPSQPPVPVAVEAASVGPIASYYSATATLGAEKEAQILARITGVAKSLWCEEGDEVREGQKLLQIDNNEYRLRLQQAEASREDLEARHERMKKMLSQNLVSAEEFDAVQRDLTSAQAGEGLARLNFSYTTIVAPFSGRVVQRLTDVGQNVNPGTPLFVLADFTPLLARVYVPAKQLGRLKADQSVDLVLESSGVRLSGRITLVSPVIDATSGTVKITIEVTDYPEDTRPGDFAEVRIVTERRTGSTLVPKIALVIDKGEQVVYVAADSTAERRVVDVGFQDDDHAEILSGIASGEDIVVKGQRSLKHGSPIKILPDGIVEREPEAEQAREGS